MYRHLLINVDELWLKGKNRPAYFSALRSHIKEIMNRWMPKKYTLKCQNQRFVAEFQEGFAKGLLDDLSKVPGIYSLIPSRKVSCDFMALAEMAVQEIGDKIQNQRDGTFKVYCRRIDKKFPYNSMEIAEQVGGKILEMGERSSLNLKVDVVNPEIAVNIKIFPGKAYLSTEIIYGVGGLPLGTSGHLVTLISGGFDSPVASYMMSRRGCLQTFMFFHSYPFVEEEVLDKILSIFRVLAKYQRNPLLYRIPFGNLQQKILEKCRPAYRTLFFRHYMLLGASLLAKKVAAEALLTGDCLSQVSSQTIGNLSLLDRSALLPVFRPLLGFNKSEIISWAKKVGTHDISLLPQDDACSLLSPKHPILAPKKDYWESFIEHNNFEDDLFSVINSADVYTILDGKSIEKVNSSTGC